MQEIKSMDEVQEDKEIIKLYKYRVVKEDVYGNQGKRVRFYYSFEEKLNVGSLYLHLGKGYPGMQRVLSVEVEELPV